MNSSEELKRTFKDFKKSMLATAIVWPIIIVVVAIITLSTLKIQNTYIQSVAWIGIGTAILSFILYIYSESTMQKKGGYNEVEGNIFSRFFLRVSQVMLLTLLGMPAACVLIDHLAGLKNMVPFPYNWLGLLIFIPALLLEIWTLYTFITKGQGTPIPLEATRKLITEGPYHYIRNPMLMGTSLIMGGLAVILSSYTLLVLFIVLCIHSQLFTVNVEEKEMEARFGQKWEEYKARVPMWIPNLRRTSNQ